MINRVSSAVALAEEVSKKMFSNEETEQFLDVIDEFVSQAIEDVSQDSSEISDENAMNHVFSAIAFQFFAAGIVWGADSTFKNEELNGAGNPDFTVAVETTEFLAALVRNGSITVRFAMEDNNEME